MALTIEAALQDYRTANDNGHAENRGFQGIRYAATRADVVGHSQGGQLTRFYIADGMPALIDRVGYTSDLPNHRVEGSSNGRWPFLRNDNFGAGSIRRFITLGSPFKGSPYANVARQLLGAGDAGQPASPEFHLIATWYTLGGMSQSMEDLLFPGGTYLEPTCVVDLSEQSEAQLALEAAAFPTGNCRVRWFPIVGIATDNPGNVPMQSLLWELLFAFLPFIPNDQNPTTYNPVGPNDSDLIVPQRSQRNSGGEGHPNALAGEEFPYTAHSRMGPLPGETEQHAISVKVAELLSGWPTVFDSSWSIGP